LLLSATTALARPGSRFHTSIRIIACGHVVGEECLNAWLDTGSTCPVAGCNRLLFELIKDAISTRDANEPMRDLDEEYGEHHVLTVLARLIEKQEEDSKKLKQQHEIEVTKQRLRDEKKREEEMAMDEDDWMGEDDGELDLGRTMGSSCLRVGRA
jgi:hypothetical protein